MDHVRWGILGASRFALSDMGPALHAADGGDLVAVASRCGQKAQAFKTISPHLDLFDSYEALVGSDRVDAIYIPLPNALHVEWTLKALEAGKHVLCEKPMAMAASDFDRLIAARDKSGLLAAEAYMPVHHPQWARVHALLAQGQIGKLMHIEARFTFFNDDKGDIRNQAALGGGALRDIGVYVIGTARFATGLEPTDIGARLRVEDGFDTFADMQARFGDATYSAYVSTRMLRDQGILFHGTEGVISLQAPYNGGVHKEAQIEITTASGELRIERFPTVRQYDLQVAAFNRCVLTNAPFACPLEFSRGTQEMIDAVLQTGERID
ncbi:Gfo/Idh/MocA family protein [Nereida sp. MMG025]|uniref:Gfo/Idh/MocA family protein n=1 Tax=Nereida sp. MMG025 TaxID=2909981 RepID=UPI001F2A1006|nr:Gfo/Idh/MocA family oxidoreductase [Nereida sp. MMG025]MCF6445157.1 Gfo/Idh/MocA family oxidoreductase [Nereida sp. MMG025]